MQQINKLKDKNHKIISLNVEKAFDKIQALLHEKGLEILGLLESYTST